MVKTRIVILVILLEICHEARADYEVFKNHWLQVGTFPCWHVLAKFKMAAD